MNKSRLKSLLSMAVVGVAFSVLATFQWWSGPVASASLGMVDRVKKMTRPAEPKPIENGKKYRLVTHMPHRAGQPWKELVEVKE